MNFARIEPTKTLALACMLMLILTVGGGIPGSAPVYGDTRGPDIPQAASPERPSSQGSGITPSSGPPGTSITVRAAGFRSFEPVESIALGGRNILGNRTVNTDANGEFEVSGLTVPALDPGTAALTVRVGSGDLETTVTGAFQVTAADELAPVSAAAQALEPLGDALERVFHFDNETKAWSFYDPRPDFTDANILEELVAGQVYWFKVTGDVSATLNGRQRELTCSGRGTPQENCWNLVVW